MLFLVQAGFIPLAYFKFIKIYINNLTPKGVNPKLDSLLHSVCHTKLPTSTEYSCLTGDTKKYKHNFYVWGKQYFKLEIMEYLEKNPFVLEDHSNYLKFKETLYKKKKYKKK